MGSAVENEGLDALERGGGRPGKALAMDAAKARSLLMAAAVPK